MSKRGLIILVLGVLFGVYFFVVGYEFLEKENALWQKKVKAAKEEQRRCEARNAKYKNTNPSRTLIAPPPLPELWTRMWTDAFNRVHAGQTEAEVEVALGNPGYTRCDINKAGDKFEGSVWQYTMFMPPGMANPTGNDTIQVVFGPDGRVEDKSMLNLQAKPAPTPSATAAASATPVNSPAPSAAPTPAVSPDVSTTPAASPGAPAAGATPAATASPSPQ